MKIVIGINHAAAMMPRPPENTITMPRVTQLMTAAAVYIPLVGYAATGAPRGGTIGGCGGLAP